ncbi:hypothetical protein C4623_23825 (plasmid) [Escherichia albertii]|nr:hypothetical protein C4623_23825 [Escherichia albertii]
MQMPFLKSDRQSGYQTRIKRLIVIRHSLHFCDAILIVSPSTIFTESSVGKMRIQEERRLLPAPVYLWIMLSPDLSERLQYLKGGLF